MSTQTITPEVIPPQVGPDVVETRPKLLKNRKRKYDGRAKNSFTASNLPDHGSKPLWAKGLASGSAFRALKPLDQIAAVEQIYRAAFERGQLALCWQIRQDLENRAFGKPFQAVNPNASNDQAKMRDDNRLQMAIGTLVVGGTAKKGKKQTLQQAAVLGQLTSGTP